MVMAQAALLTLVGSNMVKGTIWFLSNRYKLQKYSTFESELQHANVIDLMQIAGVARGFWCNSEWSKYGQFGLLCRVDVL